MTEIQKSVETMFDYALFYLPPETGESALRRRVEECKNKFVTDGAYVVACANDVVIACERAAARANEKNDDAERLSMAAQYLRAATRTLSAIQPLRDT